MDARATTLPKHGLLVTTPAEAIATLDGIAREMDALSASLAKLEREYEPVERAYEDFLSDYETGLWAQHVDNGAKFPPEKLRVQLAHRAMDPNLYGKYFAYTKSRKRMDKRISALKAAADAQRSILSALKVEAEASR